MVEVKLGAATATRIEESYEPNFEAQKFFPDWKPAVVQDLPAPAYGVIPVVVGHQLDHFFARHAGGDTRSGRVLPQGAKVAGSTSRRKGRNARSARCASSKQRACAASRSLGVRMATTRSG